MPVLHQRTIIPVLLAVATSGCPAPAWAGERIVFIGDSITDGHTCPLLVRQALADAKKPVPTCINAGVASDTAALVRKRLERDVLVHKPTLATLSIGPNDAFRQVKVEDYQADVTAIIERLQKDKIPLVILTTTVLGPKHAAAEKRLDEFNAILRKLAEKHGCRVAEVNQLSQEARKNGATLFEPDEVHLSFAGYRVMARAVLDALGYKDVPVPTELKLEPMPGIVRQWRMRPQESPLDEKTVAMLKPDDSWKEYRLPETEPIKHWWQDHERQRGFGMSLDRLVGKGKGFVGVAILETDQPKEVFLNTGAQLQTIWLNGKCIYRNEGWTGWHAGKERLPATLAAGKNTIVIEVAGNAFFLSITDTNDW
jgi:lysophospholipase L1-like esterase